jgi:hypothetical protein
VLCNSNASVYRLLHSVLKASVVKSDTTHTLGLEPVGALIHQPLEWEAGLTNTEILGL